MITLVLKEFLIDKLLININIIQFHVYQYECITYCDTLKISLQSSQLSVNVIDRESCTQTTQEIPFPTLTSIFISLHANSNVIYHFIYHLCLFPQCQH